MRLQRVDALADGADLSRRENLFVADGGVFVSASCQNPTWTILALCWRAMDYLKGEMKAGNV